MILSSLYHLFTYLAVCLQIPRNPGTSDSHIFIFIYRHMHICQISLMTGSRSLANRLHEEWYFTIRSSDVFFLARLKQLIWIIGYVHGWRICKFKLAILIWPSFRQTPLRDFIDSGPIKKIQLSTVVLYCVEFCVQSIISHFSQINNHALNCCGFDCYLRAPFVPEKNGEIINDRLQTGNMKNYADVKRFQMHATSQPFVPWACEKHIPTN